jgi:hypothetical protein
MTRCTQCRHENPADAKFCLECGYRMALACAACGTELPVGPKFCKECGRTVDTPTPIAPTPTRVGGSPESYTARHLAATRWWTSVCEVAWRVVRGAQARGSRYGF